MTGQSKPHKDHKARRARRARRARKARKPCEPCESDDSSGDVYTRYNYRRRPFAELMRQGRRDAALEFLSHQKFRGAYPCGDVKKTIIDSGVPFSWPEADKSTGFTWIAVYGVDLMCVVFKKDENAARRGGYLNPRYLGSYYGLISSTVIPEMEDLADSTIGLNRISPPTKPFAVVCETTSTTNVHEASSAAPDSTTAVNFIHGKIRSGISFDDDIESIQVCVWTLMGQLHLLSDEIERHLAVINRPVSGGYIEDPLADINVRDSEGCVKERLHDNGGFIEKHLAVNEPDSGGSVAGPQ